MPLIGVGVIVVGILSLLFLPPLWGAVAIIAGGSMIYATSN